MILATAVRFPGVHAISVMPFPLQRWKNKQANLVSDSKIHQCFNTYSN